MKNKKPAHQSGKRVSKFLFRVPTRLPPDLVQPYYGTMTTARTIPDYERYNPSSGLDF